MLTLPGEIHIQHQRVPKHGHNGHNRREHEKNHPLSLGQRHHGRFPHHNDVGLVVLAVVVVVIERQQRFGEINFKAKRCVAPMQKINIVQHFVERHFSTERETTVECVLFLSLLARKLRFGEN
jgi:hypothetical protein